MGNRERILEISYNHKLSHLGSCLSALGIMEEIYATKEPEEKFVLSCGHAHLAHAVVLETLGLVNAEKSLENWGIHCDRNAGCDVSTGSLGQGLPIAVGMALANRDKNVFCLVSDGELAEGSCWEALEVKKKYKLDNLKVYVNINGWGAYDSIDTEHLKERLKPYGVQIRETSVEQYDFLRGQSAHYYTMTDEDYKSTL